jgi:hypothetical protein
LKLVKEFITQGVLDAIVMLNNFIDLFIGESVKRIIHQLFPRTSRTQSLHHLISWYGSNFAFVDFPDSSLNFISPQRINALLILTVQAVQKMLCQHCSGARRKRQRRANYFFVRTHRFLHSLIGPSEARLLAQSTVSPRRFGQNPPLDVDSSLSHPQEDLSG